MSLADFFDRIGTNFSNNISDAGPMGLASLGAAIASAPRNQWGSAIAQGLGGMTQMAQAERKKRTLADALQGAMGDLTPQQKAFLGAVEPEQAAGIVGANLFQKPSEKPTEIREYEFAKSQGFTGSFMDYQTALGKSRAPSTTVNVGGERAFDKGVGEFQAKSYGEMATEGLNAKSDLGAINELEQRLKATPGGFVGGLQQLGNSIGVPIGKGASDAQAAAAIIAKLVPNQRQPGSGQMSDRDVQLFKDSLPKLINTPEGNAMIIATMKAMAQFKVDQAKIAAAAMNGQITRQQSMEALMNLPDPMDQFKARLKGGSVTPGPRKVLKFNPATGAVE